MHTKLLDKEILQCRTAALVSLNTEAKEWCEDCGQSVG
jgi:hypothetical protein